MNLHHFNQHGDAIMVDISKKAETAREAIDEGRISMNQECFDQLKAGSPPPPGLHSAIHGKFCNQLQPYPPDCYRRTQALPLLSATVSPSKTHSEAGRSLRDAQAIAGSGYLSKTCRPLL